jgi:ABC-type Mn2+/Zn2+ transport system ATPase subunit
VKQQIQQLQKMVIFVSHDPDDVARRADQTLAVNADPASI